MTTRKTLKFAVFAAALLGATLAHAAENNPLHPSYFWDKAPVVQTVAGSGTIELAQATNPLHPGYFQDKVEVTPFIATAATAEQPERNPLHPKYQHN